MASVIWDRRTRLALIWCEWLALVLGIFVTIFVSGGATPVNLGAAAIAGLYVMASSVTPVEWFRRPLVLDGAVVIGVVLTMLAVTLTGSADSPYLLLAITPTLLAGFFGGARPAFSAALLASGMLWLIELSDVVRNIPGVLLATGIQLLMAITITQVRRLLGEMQSRSQAMEKEQVVAAQRIAQLQTAHDLLARLSELTANQETNPMKLATTALESLVVRHPTTAAAAAITSDKGPVLVARVGIEPPNPQRLTLPLRAAGKETGWVMLASQQPLSKVEIAELEESLRPLALAFSNVSLLQEIAEKAIFEERSRIARELHDDLGPSLASLGLGLDLAMVQNPTTGPLGDQLTQLRRSVSYLVDDIRRTVADLRSEPEPSLTNALKQSAIHLSDAPEVLVSIDERRPPRPSVAQDLAAITSEAIRNAAKHAHAQKVVVGGVVNFDRGWLTIHDDGRGFDQERVEEGHFGIIGMRERAQKIGALLEINSSAEEGTTVSIEWGPR
jgi:signal transduction histidine kinase